MFVYCRFVLVFIQKTFMPKKVSQLWPWRTDDSEWFLNRLCVGYTSEDWFLTNKQGNQIWTRWSFDFVFGFVVGKFKHFWEQRKKSFPADFGSTKKLKKSFDHVECICVHWPNDRFAITLHKWAIIHSFMLFHSKSVLASSWCYSK